MLAEMQETKQVIAKRIILSLRNQMEVFTKNNLTPKYVTMNVADYGYLQYACDVQNSDRDTVNGLPIVICEHSKIPSVTTSPTDLIKQGLL